MVKTNFVVVSATLLGTQDPRQAFESVSEEGPYTFLEILGHVLLCLFSIIVRIAPITLPRHGKKKCGNTIRLCAGSLSALGNSRRQDGFDSAKDSFCKS